MKNITLIALVVIFAMFSQGCLWMGLPQEPDNVDELLKDHPEHVTKLNLDPRFASTYPDDVKLGDLKKLGKFVNLEQLHMPLIGIPTNDIFLLKKLEILDLSSAPKKYDPNYNNNSDYLFPEYGFDVLPSEIKNLANLKVLDLSGCKITTLIPEIFELKKLEVLNIDYTYVKEIPSDISVLQNLSELHISKTDIKDLPDSITKCRNLKIFHSGLDKKRIGQLSKNSSLKFINTNE